MMLTKEQAKEIANENSTLASVITCIKLSAEKGHYDIDLCLEPQDAEALKAAGYGVLHHWKDYYTISWYN